ncbi:hypothetical protein VPH35_019900 [Triticum aestivum]
MDSPQKKAGSTMDGETRHLLLPVSVTAAKKTLLAARPDAVRVAVSAWVLFIASIYLLFFAVEGAVHHYHGRLCRQEICRRLTDTEEALDNTLKMAMLFCGVFQAASALLALRLPRHCRWVCRALDYLALALTIGGHCIYAAAARLVLVADPGDVYFRIAFAVVIVIFAAGDIIGFLALLLLGGEA